MTISARYKAKPISDGKKIKTFLLSDMCVRLYRLQPKISYTKELFFFLDLEIYQRKKIRTKINYVRKKLAGGRPTHALLALYFFFYCAKRSVSRAKRVFDARCFYLF